MHVSSFPTSREFERTQRLQDRSASRTPTVLQNKSIASCRKLPRKQRSQTISNKISRTTVEDALQITRNRIASDPGSAHVPSAVKSFGFYSLVADGSNHSLLSVSLAIVRTVNNNVEQKHAAGMRKGAKKNEARRRRPRQMKATPESLSFLSIFCSRKQFSDAPIESARHIYRLLLSGTPTISVGLFCGALFPYAPSICDALLD